MALPALILGLDLHAGHVHTRGAFALTALAAHAECECLGHRLARNVLVAQLSTHRHAQGIGPPPHRMLLITRDPVARTHRARIKLAAVAVVVAHLHGLGQAERLVVATSGRAHINTQPSLRTGPRGVVLHIPGRPVQPGLKRRSAIARAIPKELHVVHFGRSHDLSGVHTVLRIESVLHPLKGARDFMAKLP